MIAMFVAIAVAMKCVCCIAHRQEQIREGIRRWWQNKRRNSSRPGQTAGAHQGGGHQAQGGHQTVARPDEQPGTYQLDDLDSHGRMQIPRLLDVDTPRLMDLLRNPGTQVTRPMPGPSAVSRLSRESAETLVDSEGPPTVP
jgi:hypothetical protein